MDLNRLNGSMVKLVITLDFESRILGSSPGGTLFK